MKRRQFIALLGGATVGWPFVTRVQQVGKLPTIGVLGVSSPSNWTHWVAVFVRRLAELGWIDGRTVAIEYRWAEGRYERYAEFAAEFVRLKVDVIVTTGSAVVAAKQATSVIPWFKRMCREAGLPVRASVHGLRKAACRRLAEAGCSASVIASISGHATLREVSRYTAAAEQTCLARQGIEAVTRTKIGNPAG